MKYFINNLLFPVIIVLIIIFIIFCIIPLINIDSNNINEGFTPKIRAFYRPLVRKTRIVGEGFYNKTSSKMNNLFRKFGIM
jgi:dolichol kinase